MKALSRLLVFIFVAGIFSRVPAAEFAKQIPSGGFLYLEVRNTQDYRNRFSEFPALQELKNYDWKSLLLQLYQVSVENSEDANTEKDVLSTAELDEFITEIKEKWEELNSQLSGEFAFSLGDFQNAFDVFNENAVLRKELGLFSLDLAEDELSGEQIAEQENRLLQEKRLDEREIASIFGEVQIWARVKAGEGQDAKLESWLAETMSPEADDDYSLSQQEWKQTTLYVISTPGEEDSISFSWAIKDGFWIITFTTEALKAAIDGLVDPLEDALATQETYIEALEFVGSYDSLLYVDFSPLNNLLRKGLEKLPEDKTDMIPQAEEILAWFGIDALLPYVMGTRLDQKGLISRGRAGFSRETSLSRIIIDPDAGAVEVPPFVHRDFSHFSTFDWHLGNGWGRLEIELTKLSPQAAAAMGLGRMLAAGQLGFDLKLQFFDHLEGSTVFVQTFDPEVINKMAVAAQNEDLSKLLKVQMEHPTGGQNYLLGFKMKNQPAIEEAMERLMQRFHPTGAPQPVDFEGQAIYYPIPEEIQNGKFKALVSYTYLDDYILLAIGDDTLLQQAVLANRDPSLQLTNQETFKLTRARLASEAGALEYSNGKHQENAMKMLESSLSMLQSENPDLQLPDLSKLVGFITQAMKSSTRKGMVFEMESILEFAPAE